MSEIVLWKIKDTATGEELPENTPTIRRTVQVMQELNIPLYRNGVIIPKSELTELGLEKVGYTQDQLDTIHYSNIYAFNPRLADRVREYRDHLDALQVGYAATTNEIDAAIQIRGGSTPTAKLELASRIRTTFEDIVVNLEAIGYDTASWDAWSQMPKLIQYLPPPENGE